MGIRWSRMKCLSRLWTKMGMKARLWVRDGCFLALDLLDNRFVGELSGCCCCDFWFIGSLYRKSCSVTHSWVCILESFPHDFTHKPRLKSLESKSVPTCSSHLLTLPQLALFVSLALVPRLPHASLSRITNMCVQLTSTFTQLLYELSSYLHRPASTSSIFFGCFSKNNYELHSIALHKILGDLKNYFIYILNCKLLCIMNNFVQCVALWS
jgi:hypothetical protein